MTVAVLSRLRGSSLAARAVRSSLLTMGGFGYAQALRLATNLVLTRLLFPEAFGLMALVTVVLIGLTQFSDVGTTPAIMQSKRGDDPAFLDTAWTIQVVRGFLLWLAACVLALPMSWIYGEPMLAQLLPVASLSLVVMGFKPTRIITANRHLILGRVTLLEVSTHTVGAVLTVSLAYATGSVWALVVSTVAMGLFELAVNSYFLSGHRNRFRWERAAAAELIRFGKWVFLATVAGFLFSQADKLLIGKYLPIDLFGIYNIGYFLASFPVLLGGMLMSKLLIPIYRESPPKESRENYLKLRRMRVLMTVCLLVLIALVALGGVWLVDVLYDPRYAMAGAITVLVACAQIPHIVVQTYGHSALASGQSKLFFVLAASRAVLMIAGIALGLQVGGLAGGIAGMWVAYVAAYPVVVWLSWRTGAWDPLHDAVFMALSLALTAGALWLNRDALMPLLALQV